MLKTSNFVVRLPENLLAKLRERAKLEDVPLSQILRRALKKYLDEVS